MEQSLTLQIILAYEKGLLYETIHGHEMDARSYQKGNLYDLREVFFNESGWDQVPMYTSSRFDRQLSRSKLEEMLSSWVISKRSIM
ncbi:hypothetical protein N7462_009249 [Penicillium macrosclerotiorum]|uniref:uncharacterized protein n=1 Tax=Penicillium macrosclerotiorum TaxID=303699 RepID=UPI002547AEAA|nr:uncharacterized protein N7462_009249 [Penicillium macrosclerotiorum]KAJ5673810.1 hypothetical protein N7462_009249 [Penicillium macrosclerotiorum]